MFPLLSPQQRIDALKDTYHLDVKDLIIGGITTVVGAGVGVGVTQKVSDVLPLEKVAKYTDKVAASISSKFNILIRAEIVEDGLAKGSRFVISRTLGGNSNFITTMVVQTSLEAAEKVTGGSEEEPSIGDELLAFTANPTLILLPISGQKTPPADEDRYLFRIPKPLSEIAVTIEQVYLVDENLYTAKYQGVYPLAGGAAAPGLPSMSLSEYPPFQWLSPEAQAYLLRDFGMFVSPEAWQVPETTALLPNYPNPFNPETWIPYQLAEAADVMLTIYDIYGRVVRDLDLGHQRAGTYHGRSRAAYWDGRNAQGEPVASGLYFYTLKAGDFTATRKMLIRK